MTHSNNPNLSVRISCPQPMSGLQSSWSDFEITSLNVDGDNLTLMVRFDLSPDALLIHFRASTSMLFFAELGLDSHGLVPTSTING